MSFWIIFWWTGSFSREHRPRQFIRLLCTKTSWDVPLLVEVYTAFSTGPAVGRPNAQPSAHYIAPRQPSFSSSFSSTSPDQPASQNFKFRRIRCIPLESHIFRANHAFKFVQTLSTCRNSGLFQKLNTETQESGAKRDEGGLRINRVRQRCQQAWPAAKQKRG